MTLSLRFVTHSEIGLVRKNNQDSGYASPNLLLVADGMGGAAAGDLASAVAVHTIRQIDAPTPAPQMLDALTRALHQANDRIADLVESDYSLDGMGTTVTGALFDGHELGLAHIGDSRAYLFRDGSLERLTHDHSWVQSLVDDGKINEAEALVHPHRSLLLRVLNGQPANKPDLTRLTLLHGDRLLFCSDGLCGLVDDDSIAETLAEPELETALGRLVAEARAEGGIDNITVILADVVETEGTTGAVVLGAAAEHDLPVVADLSSTAVQDGVAPDEPDPPVAGAAQPDAGEDEARYNPQPPHKRRLLRPLVGVLVLLLVVAAGLGTAYAWTRTQYYVGHPTVAGVRGAAAGARLAAAVLRRAGARRDRGVEPGLRTAGGGNADGGVEAVRRRRTDHHPQPEAEPDREGVAPRHPLPGTCRPVRLRPVRRRHPRNALLR
jgi:serine/threonine protein phosphatase PrpC